MKNLNPKFINDLVNLKSTLLKVGRQILYRVLNKTMLDMISTTTGAKPVTTPSDIKDGVTVFDNIKIPIKVSNCPIISMKDPIAGF
jgi:hypothetical protein